MSMCFSSRCLFGDVKLGASSRAEGHASRVQESAAGELGMQTAVGAVSLKGDITQDCRRHPRARTNRSRWQGLRATRAGRSPQWGQ